MHRPWLLAPARLRGGDQRGTLRRAERALEHEGRSPARVRWVEVHLPPGADVVHVRSVALYGGG